MKNKNALKRVEELKKQLAAATEQKLLPEPTDQQTGDTKAE